MKKRFMVLDSFRGIFSIMVAIFHFKAAGPIGELLLVQRSSHFVDFFFVLSGFIIYHTYGNIMSRIQQTHFLKNRIIRLYPLHFFGLFVMLSMEVSKYFLQNFGLFKSPVFEKNNLYSFFVNILLLQSFDLTALSWNYPSWSISAEMFSYIMFCVIIINLQNMARKKRIFIFFVICAVSMGLIRLLTGSFSIDITSNWGALRSIFGFFIGCVTYEAYLIYHTRKQSIKKHSIIEILSISVSILLTMYIPQSINFFLTLSYAFTIFVFAFETGTFSRFLTVNPLVRLGELSYSIYLMHACVAIMFEVGLTILGVNSPIILIVTLCIYLTVVVSISTITHKYIEVGIGKWLKNRRTLVSEQRIAT